eukprot:CAMPEP_0197020314 /NCGR_PEP_ID=MMETSP1384-20130603/1090_1 /TAXON_ID=29189 /ORGANISM="Ammonia sp." /LENGTH=192 /DNA_ID=CAMNT_0042447919 /DNA_START=45 /DNA_END=623 /DNA_ORIENTATION=+
MEVSLAFYTVLFSVCMLEHFFYSFVWFKPKVARRMMTLVCGAKTDPCIAVHYGLMFNKLLQFSFYFYMCYAFNFQFAFFVDDVSIPYGAVSIYIALILVGQYLNFSVYRAIGFEGVYYGIKFGKKVPWCSEFPYNVTWLKDPQYLGAWLSYFNAIFVLKSIMVPNAALAEIFGILQILLTFSYMFMSYVEST